MKAFRICLLMVGIFCLLPLQPVQAQSCRDVTILNQSDQRLDADKICNAGLRWVQRSHHVYVWVTARSAGATEKDWLAMRDQTETAWGIYNASDDTFNVDAVAVELSLDTSKSYGQDFAFGERVFGTALDDDQVVNSLESSLKQKVASGDITAAIVDTLNAAFDKAYSQPARPIANTQNSSQSGEGSPSVGTIILIGVLALGGWALFKIFGVESFTGSSGGSSYHSYHRSSSSSHRSMGSSRRR